MSQLRRNAMACVGVAGILLAVMTGGSQSGCATLNSACAKALPTLISAQTLLTDAQSAMDQAEAAIETMPPSIQEKAMDALNIARMSLRAAASTLVLATNACDKPDIPTIFASFIDAWKAIRGFIDVFAGPDSKACDPLIYRMHMSQQTSADNP